MPIITEAIQEMRDDLLGALIDLQTSGYDHVIGNTIERVIKNLAQLEDEMIKMAEWGRPL